MEISVVIPTHQPDRTRLRRTLAGLKHQTLESPVWETVIIDNASDTPVSIGDFSGDAPANLRVVREPQLGLTAARRRGFNDVASPIIVMVDDDNVLARDYLTTVRSLFAVHSRVGALGGRSVPEFETTPPDWVREFDGLIACRDIGPAVRISHGLRPAGAQRNVYPSFAPIGAGMALRRDAIQGWLTSSTTSAISDRRGTELSSGGDNDIVFAVMKSGWEVGYFPELTLTHLIPTGRTQRDYLARLNHGIARSWMKVLSHHDANPWPPLSSWSVPLRKMKTWFSYRAWSSPAAYVRWQGACGHFEGRIRTS